MIIIPASYVDGVRRPSMTGIPVSLIAESDDKILADVLMAMRQGAKLHVTKSVIGYQYASLVADGGNFWQKIPNTVVQRMLDDKLVRRSGECDLVLRY